MAAGDTYVLKIRGLVQGQRIETVHHFAAVAGGDLSLQIPTDWQVSCKTDYLSTMPSDYTLTSLQCRQINPPGPIGADVVPGGGVTGTLAAASGPLNQAAVITWTTGFIGRRRRGRSFIGPMGTGSVLNGNVIAAVMTLLGNYRDQMITDFAAGGTYAASERLVIWSETIAGLNPQDPPPAVGAANSAQAYVLAGRVNVRARSQRRRNLGIGE